MESWTRMNWLSNFLHILGLMLFISYIDAIVEFTDVPPKVLYVSTNGTAKFKWVYTVTNRDNELKDQSPTWDLYLPNGTSIQLAYENINNRLWRVSDSCPSRLRGRIKIEPPGTLVISQVTSSDNGVYGCSLRLKTGELLTNTSQLIVFDPPVFTNLPPDKIVLKEGRGLDVTCSASGSPVPIVSWSSPKGISDIITRGRGRARLRISNIRRESNGTYWCQANNKLQEPITKHTTVLIYYQPSIRVAPSTLLDTPSWDNHMVTLHCLATGNPSPTISWKNPSGDFIQYGVSSMKDGSLLTLTTKTDNDYGKYKCHAVNSVGLDELTFKVYKIAVPDPPIIKKTTSEATVISITWRRAPNDGGSPIIDYRIFINTNPTREVSVRNSFIVLAALEEDTSYLVNISARNIVGYGNATTVIAKTMKGSSLPSTKSSAVLAVCLPIIFILILVIIALLIYLWWKIRRGKEGADQPDTAHSTEANQRKKDVSNCRAVEERSKQNGHVRSETERKGSGSCFQPFVIRPRRRRGQPRPLPLHILEPIKEENTDEEAPEIIEEEEEDEEGQYEEISNQKETPPVKYEEITIEPVILNELPKTTDDSVA